MRMRKDESALVGSLQHLYRSSRPEEGLPATGTAGTTHPRPAHITALEYASGHTSPYHGDPELSNILL